MKLTVPFTRPALDDALSAWKKTLAERGFATDLLWIFEENLCFEKSAAGKGGFHPGFQIKFTPPFEGALDIAYDHFYETDKRIVFYRLGENQRRSVCVVVCDEWFEGRDEAEGYLRRDEWRMSFYPGRKEEIEEVTDLGRWLQRIKRGRPLHDLDFCMTLATIDEIRLHGRALLPYERFAETILNRLRRVFSHAT